MASTNYRRIQSLISGNEGSNNNLHKRPDGRLTNRRKDNRERSIPIAITPSRRDAYKAATFRDSKSALKINSLYQPSDWLIDGSPIAAGDGHYLPWLLNQRVPGIAAVIDDIVEGFEYAVG